MSTNQPVPVAQEHFHIDKARAEGYMTKARQYLCKNAVLSIYLRHADQDKLEYRWGMKNDGCRNPKMHAHARCASCTLAYRSRV